MSCISLFIILKHKSQVYSFLQAYNLTVANLEDLNTSIKYAISLVIPVMCQAVMQNYRMRLLAVFKSGGA